MSQKAIKDKVISFRIEHKASVDVMDLTEGLTSFCRLYDSISEEGETRLKISGLKEGSIIIEILATAAVLIENIHPAFLVMKHLSVLLKHLLSYPNNNPEESVINEKNLGNFVKIANISSKEGTELNISVQGNDNNIIINHESYQKINKNYNELSKIKGEASQEVDNVLFYWTQTNFDKLDTGNRGIIRNLDKTPKKVIFESTKLKKAMISGNNWQGKGYLVNVTILRDPQDNIKVYKIKTLRDTVD